VKISNGVHSLRMAREGFRELSLNRSEFGATVHCQVGFLRKVLQQKGIPAIDIAKMLGVSRATVYRYLADDEPLSA
jgi:predicted transcriptional regulator